jgi:hypothetical protein
MITSTHTVAPEGVMAFLDGELSSAEAQAVSEHVRRCTECAGLAKQFRGTSSSLSQWSVPVVPRKVEDIVKELTSKKSSGGKIDKANMFIRASFWGWKQWTVWIGATIVGLVVLLAASSFNVARRRASIDKAAVSVAAQASARQNEIDGYGTAGKLEAGRNVISGQAGVAKTAPPPSAGPMLDALTGFGVGTGSGGGKGPAPSAAGREVDSLVSVHAPMIARTVTLTVVTKDLAASRTFLEVILARRHGYAAQMNVNTPENAPRSLQASLRIPTAELASAVGDLKALGRVENEAQSGEEVTQQHADLVARLKNSRETEQRLQAILTQRTGKMSDVLEVEQEIARVRGEIEGMEAEQKNLEHRVDFATVNLQLTEEYKAQLVAPTASVSTRMHNAIVAGLQNVSDMALGIVLFFFEEGPTMMFWLAILLTPLWIVWKRYRRAMAPV